MAATPPSTDPHELLLALIGAHAGSLLAVARRHSLCADDAQDAYQRALEIFLHRGHSVDPAKAPAWLRTVVKHEALAVRAARQRIVGPAEVDMDRAEAREQLPADERVAAVERDARSAEALARLKPHETRALVLKAHGYSYHEICEITGWSYTKVNRCLTEGRRAFLDRFADIEAGRECARWTATLSALADGEASPADLAAARPHLRHCPACRATLREFRAAPAAVAALAPALLSGPAADGELPGLVARVHDAVVASWHERVVLSAQKVHAALEAASAGKLAAAAASATALAGGGAAALDRVAERPPAKPAVATAVQRRAERPPPAVSAPSRLASAPASVPARVASPRRRPEPKSRPAPPNGGVGEFGLGGESGEATGSKAVASSRPAPTPPAAPPASPPARSASAISSSSEFAP
jgi:RNA polymerase sigma factor (sigma-70 family)